MLIVVNNLKRQLIVGKAICDQLASGDDRVIGVMIESNLVEGNQSLEPDKPLVYGQSITDQCMGWEDTEVLLKMLSDAVAEGFSHSEV